MHIRNGMPAIELGPDGWRKPWSGSNGGVCLEAKKLPGGRVALIRAFVQGAKAGLADELLT
jgi:hypothetical protein